MPITRRELLRTAAGAAALSATGLPGLAAAADRKPAFAVGFSSLRDEVRIPRLDVEGRLPEWLDGTLLRNGPALFEVGPDRFNHWFDGLAMLHAFAVRGGRVSYANRFLRSSAYTAAKRDGRIKFSEFGTDPCRKIFSGVSTLPVLGRIPNANVSIERLADTFRAHTELPVPVRFDPRSLRTLGVDTTLPVGRMGTAHPHHDPATGERFSYELELVPPSGVRVVSERGGRRRELAFVAQERPGYLHSFGLTPRYVVLFTQPFQFDLARFLSPDRGPIVTNFGWDAAQPSTVTLIDRAAGGVAATAELEPFFVFHHINAFEEGGKVCLDVCAHRDSSIIDALYLKRLRAADRPVPQAVARRITVVPATGRAEHRDLSDEPIELPRTDYARVNGGAYRFAYGIGVRDARRSRFVDRLAKLDVRTGKATTWQERGAYPGEPVFVRRPGARREDDGVVLSVVLDAERRTSYLAVLDARTLGDVARASVPHHIPFGFHGIFAS